MPREFMTDEMVEEEILRLQCSPPVKTDRKEAADGKGKRRLPNKHRTA